MAAPSKPSMYRSLVSVHQEMRGRLRLSTLEISVQNLPPALEGLRAVQISDLHLGKHTSKHTISEAVAISKNLSPDLVFYTGDFIDLGKAELKHKITRAIGIKHSKYRQNRKKASATAKTLGEVIADFSPPLGSYCVWGNHDYLEGINLLKRHLPEQIQILVNESITIPYKNSEILLSGIDDYREGTPSIEEMLAQHSNLNEFPLRLLLAHNPDTILLDQRERLSDFDLILSGHTHGGQICLPGGIPLKTQTKQKNYCSGLGRFLNAPLYVSNGVGNSLLPMRLFCPPEIVLIIFKRA